MRCAGCSRWDQSKAKKTKQREEIKTREYQCLQAWKKKKVFPRFQTHCDAIMKHIESNYNVSREILQEAAEQAETTTTVTTTATTTTTTTAATPATGVPTPSPKGPRNVNWAPNAFFVEGQSFTIMVPTTHKTYNETTVGRWKNGYETLTRIRDKLQRKQYNTNSLFSQGLWAIAVTSVPALALSAAQVLFPLVVMAFFHDTGLFDYEKFKPKNFVTSFPSDNTLRQHNLNQATRDTITLSEKIKNRKVHMACDKGNKKGVGHFVKVMSSWDPNNGNVDLEVSDIDASGGKSDQCARAIQSSMNKLKLVDDDNTHLLHGNCTDSGGGGALDSLADYLLNVDHLCCHEDECLVANCCIHALQLQLRNAVVTALGDGGIENVNAMQLLHTVWDLQESLDLEEWRHTLHLSSQFVAQHNPDCET